MSYAPRPQLDEKAAYVPRSRPESFIVPLLKEAIDAGIKDCAAATTGPAKALDIGCGRQPFRPLLESLGYAYFGMDTQPAEDQTVAFVCPIDEPLPDAVLAAGPYDLLLCTEVLEHVAKWDAAFANFARLLSPQGKVLLTSPHFYILHEEPYDFWRPTQHAFAYYAQRHGLRCRDMRKLGDCWDILGTLLGSCRFEPVGHSRLNRLLAKALWRLRNGMFRLILNGRLRRRVSFTGPTYLSNFIILERAYGSCSGTP